jgi:hypothetical protein
MAAFGGDIALMHSVRRMQKLSDALGAAGIDISDWERNGTPKAAPGFAGTRDHQKTLNQRRR